MVFPMHTSPMSQMGEGLHLVDDPLQRLCPFCVVGLEGHGMAGTAYCSVGPPLSDVQVVRVIA